MLYRNYHNEFIRSTTTILGVCIATSVESIIVVSLTLYCSKHQQSIISLLLVVMPQKMPRSVALIGASQMTVKMVGKENHPWILHRQKSLVLQRSVKFYRKRKNRIAKVLVKSLRSCELSEKGWDLRFHNMYLQTICFHTLVRSISF